MDKEFVRVLIHDKTGRFLALCDHQNLWNFPGGKVEPWETAEQAAKREVWEEVGVLVSDLIKLYEGRYVFSGQSWTGHFFWADSCSGTPRLLEPHRCLAIEFKKFESLSTHPELESTMRRLIDEVERTMNGKGFCMLK